MAAEGLVDAFLLEEDHQEGPRPANASPPGGGQGPLRACAAAAVGCRGGSDGWAEADHEVWWWTGLASQVAAYVTEESLGQAGDQCREAHRALRDSAHRLVSQRRTIAQQQQQHRTVRGRSKPMQHMPSKGLTHAYYFSSVNSSGSHGFRRAQEPPG